jgi:hypothetical protein
MGIQNSRKPWTYAIGAFVVVLVVAGSWSAFVADDNNLLQGADSQQEVSSLVNERQRELVRAFFTGGLPWAGGAGVLALVAFVVAQRRRSNRDAV